MTPGLPEGLRLWPALLEPDHQAAAAAHLVATVPWEDHVFRGFGRRVPMPRRIAWFGPVPYGYSGVHHPARPLPPLVATLRDRVVQATGLPFTCVLVNLYRHGADSMGWHSDDDYPHGGQPAVASLSLGATRRFRLRTRGAGPRRTVGLDLPGGSLLLMGGAMQRGWQHALPKTRRPVGVRVNLTFRHVVAPASLSPG